MTKQQRFDRILENLGLAKGSELACALGLTRKSSNYCRQNGVPESRLGDLMRLTRGRDPIEMLAPVRLPAPAKQSQGRAAQMAKGDIAASNTERRYNRHVRIRSGQEAHMMCVAEFGWPVVLTRLSQDRIDHMTDPRSGRPAMTAALALDRAMKAAGKEPLCIVTHRQLSGARQEGHATHLQYAVCEISRIDKLLHRGLSRAGLDERVQGLTAIVAKSTHLSARSRSPRPGPARVGRKQGFASVGGRPMIPTPMVGADRSKDRRALVFARSSAAGSIGRAGLGPSGSTVRTTSGDSGHYRCAAAAW